MKVLLGYFRFRGFEVYGLELGVGFRVQCFWHFERSGRKD